MATDPQSASSRFVRTQVDDGVETVIGNDLVRLTWNDTRNGVSLPGWRQIIRNGGNATTPYTADIRVCKTPLITASGTVTKHGGGVSTRTTALSGPLPGIWNVTTGAASLSSASADRTARQQFVRSYRSRRTQIQSGVVLGELRKTVEMIRNPARALRQGIDAYVSTAKKRARKSKNPRKTIADTWLEYQYGWKPLVNDVASACRLATAHPHVVYEVIKGAADEKVQDTRSVLLNYSFSELKVNYRTRTTGSVGVRYLGAVRAQNQPPSFPEQLGLSWSNVLPTAWELIPYSFLVDYFTNVGAVIDGISTGRIWLAWGCKTMRRERISYADDVHVDMNHLDNFGTSSSKYFGYASGSGELSRGINYTRESIGSVSVGLGDLSFKLPGSNTRWLNIAALATSRSYRFR